MCCKFDLISMDNDIYKDYNVHLNFSAPLVLRGV